MGRFAVVVVVVIVVLVALVGVGCCTPGLILWAMTPSAAFDPAQTPAAPDYTNDAAWLALPTTKDEADVSLDDGVVSAKDATVDVFYVHPTSSVAAQWNSADAGDVRTASIRGGTLIQASAFNHSGVIWAPTYRQAAGNAFTQPSPSGERAKDVAYEDVAAAFAEFVRRGGGSRGFVVVGHSQGAVLGARLVRERIAGQPLQKNLIAAYLIGGSLRERDLGVTACRANDEVGCAVAYNARGPGHVKDEFDFGGTEDAERACVNPAVGKVGDDVVDADHHGGAVFFDAEHPAVLPKFLRSQCLGGRLVISELQPLPPRDLASGVLLQVMGGQNFHPIEFQLFYVDLAHDVARRAAAFAKASPSTAP